jgi:hypothetical protein
MADQPWLNRDYSGFWRLPEPMPPARWPRGILAGLLFEVLVLAIGACDAKGRAALPRPGPPMRKTLSPYRRWATGCQQDSGAAEGRQRDVW